MYRRGFGWWLTIGLGLLWPVMTQAAATTQLSGNVTLESDYRFRGLTLSNGQPDLRLNLALDHPSGLYGGVSAIASRYPNGEVEMLGYTGYAGFVTQPKSGPAWEAGITNTHLRGPETYDYSEVYAGVILQHISARLSYSPRYFGRHMDTLYADISGGAQVSDHVRLFAHVGALTPLSGWDRHERLDARAGAAVTVGTYELQLAWTQTNLATYPVYPARNPGSRHALVASIAAYF